MSVLKPFAYRDKSARVRTSKSHSAETVTGKPMYEQIDARITELYEPYLASLLEGNRQACQKIVSQLLASGIEIRQLYVGLFQHALYQVGELWEQNQISVAKEHLATATTESLLPLVYPVIFRTPRCGRRAVVSCVANELPPTGR